MQLWSYKRTVLAACTLAFFATMVARLVISPVVPAISDDFGVSTGAVGLVLSAMWFAYAAAQFPSGLLGDRFGERIVILVAVAATAITSGILAVAPSYGVFLLGALLLGAGAGLHYSVATTLLTRTFDQTGSAIGIHSTGAPLAGLLAPIAAGAVGSLFGWRYAVALGALVAVPMTIIFTLVVRPTDPVRPDTAIATRLDLRPLLSLLFRPPIALTVVLAVGGAFVWQATASFLPAFFIAYHGYSEVLASAIFSMYFVLQGVGQPVIGTLSDRIGRYPAAALATVVGIFGYTLFVLGDTLWVLVAATGFSGIAMSWGAALLPKFIDHLDSTERGVGFGLIRTTYMVLGASGSVVTGVVVDFFGWGVAFYMLAGVLAGMFLLMTAAMIQGQVARSPQLLRQGR